MRANGYRLFFYGPVIDNDTKKATGKVTACWAEFDNYNTAMKCYFDALTRPWLQQVSLYKNNVSTYKPWLDVLIETDHLDRRPSKV